MQCMSQESNSIHHREWNCSSWYQHTAQHSGRQCSCLYQSVEKRSWDACCSVVLHFSFVNKLYTQRTHPIITKHTYNIHITYIHIAIPVCTSYDVHMYIVHIVHIVQYTCEQYNRCVYIYIEYRLYRMKCYTCYMYIVRCTRAYRYVYMW